jgi:hypothetical protein
MQKTAEYLTRAAECRDMARIASPNRREELEHMAATFEQLAKMQSSGYSAAKSRRTITANKAISFRHFSLRL